MAVVGESVGVEVLVSEAGVDAVGFAVEVGEGEE